MNNLRIFALSFACVSFPCLIQESVPLKARLVECCIRCVARPACPNFLYSRVDRRCVRQGDSLRPSEIQNYSLVQLQRLGNKILQFRASRLTTQIAPRNKIDFQMSDKAISSQKHPDCPFRKVKAFHEACKTRELSKVKRTLALHTTILDCRGDYGRTPLLTAVWAQQMSVVKFLKDEGADLQALDQDNDNILITACASGNVDMVKYIVSLKVIDIESRGKGGATPLLEAFIEVHMRIVTFLKTQGANLEAVNDDKENMLHIACIIGLVKMVKYVMSLQVINIESRAKFGTTPLMAAVRCGHIHIVKLLYLTYGANISAIDDGHCTVLHVASLAGEIEMIKYLLTLQEMSGYEGRKDSNGNTPLGVAKQVGHGDVVRFLESRI